KPDDAELKRKLAIAERIYAKSRYYNKAREFGRLVGVAGQQKPDCQCVIMTGGGPGLMEAANRGAYDTGAKTVGLNINLPHEQFPNPYITPDLCFRFHYFAIRKLHFLLRAKALVIFPGGYGTFDELFEALTLMQTRKIQQVPVILVGERYWKDAFNIDFLVDEGAIDAEDRELFWYAETAEEIWQSILDWYNINGTPLFAE
ncbi:MAG: LOG family protein, partial [Gammaproteobacteria bacterium]